MSRKSPAHLFFLLTLSAATASAFAAPQDLSDQSLEQLLDVKVTSASKFSQRASDAPSSITIITADNIRTFGFRNLADVLASVRGFQVTSDRIYSYVGVRGFAPPGDFNDRLLVMIDGYRTNDNIFDEAFIGNEFLLDIDLIDHIEIVRGPSSSVYGSNALFGIINVITKRGKDYNGSEASVSTASFGGNKARMTYGQTLDSGLDILLSGTILDEKGPNLSFPEFASAGNPNGTTAGTDFEKNATFFSKFTLENLTLEGGVSRRNKGNPASINAGSFNDTRNRFIDQQAFADLKYSRALSSASELSARLFTGSYDFTGDYYVDPMIAPPGGFQEIAHGRWWGLEAKIVSKISADNTLVYGLEYQKNARQDQIANDVLPYAEVQKNLLSSQRYGIFAQDEHHFNNWFALTGGVRFDHSSMQAGLVSPRLAAVLKPSDTTVLKLLYGTAFRTPNAYETNYEYPGVQLSNPKLQPERMATTEIVLEQFLGDSLRLTSSVYSYLMRKQISLGTTDDQPQYLNVPNVRGHGLEFELEKLWEAGARLRGSLGLQRVQELNDQWPINSPNALLKLNFSLPLQHMNWRLGMESESASRRRTNLGETGAYTISNLTLLRPQTKDGWEITLSCRNLFNRQFGQPATDDGLGLRRDTFPQDGRIAQLKVNYSY